MYRTLSDFLRVLDDAGELHRVRSQVSPILEIAEITDRISKLQCRAGSASAAHFDPDHADLGGRALLFEDVEGCDFPLAMNVFGSYHRMELALGGGFEAIASRLASLTKPQPPGSIRELLAKAREFAPLLRVPPKRVRRGRCQEVVKLVDRGEVDLMRFPIIKCWPLDGDPEAVGYAITAEESGTARGQGRYITFAGMHTIHADDRQKAKPPSHNIGMYRAQLIDETHLAMHWHVHHDGASHWRSWKRIGEPMPIAICLGGEPVLPYAATAPLPPGISELLMAGFLNGRGIPMVRAKTVPLWVPANCEIVIEGWVSTACGGIGWAPGGDTSPEAGFEASSEHGPDGPGASAESSEGLGPGAVFEGPFGDHTGFYSMPDRYPIVEVTAMTHAREAVYPTTIVGYPPQEDYYLGKATERIFLPLLKTIIHDIDDYHLPMFGAFHNCAFVKIDKAYPLQARRVMHAIWGAGQMAWTKLIIVVDSDVDVHNERAVLRAMFANCHFGRDLEFVNGPVDILDHAAPRLGAGHKLGIDATRKVAGEAVNGVSIDAAIRPVDDVPEAIRSRSDVRVPDFGLGRLAFVGVEKARAGDGLRAIEALVDLSGASPGPDLVIAVDVNVDLDDWEGVLFHFCANCDPIRDMVVARVPDHQKTPGAGDAPGCDESGTTENDPAQRATMRDDGAAQRTGRSIIGFDATTKLSGDARNGQGVRPFPPFLRMDDATRALVDRRWPEYGFAND